MALTRGLKRYRGWIAAGVLVAVAGTAWALLRNDSGPADTITYESEAASVGTVSVTVSGTGTLQVDGTTEVYPATSGTVASIAVAEGAAVTTGTVLFTLDEADAEAATAKALATLRQAQQSVAQSELQVTKTTSALASLQSRAAEPSSTVSSADLDAAAGDLSVAKAGLASAQAQRATAQIAYNDATDAEDDLAVTAPCTGVVYSLDIAAGDSVSPGSSSSDGTTGASSPNTSATSTAASSSAPLTLAPAQPLALQLAVNEVDLPSLEVGQRADIEFDALPDFTATGKVYEIADTGSNTSGVVTFDVWISIDVVDPALRSGMSASATIVTDVAKDALIVSNSAVQSDGNGGYYVQVLDANAGSPRKVTVETGLASATQTQILSGITAGDVVVTQTVDSSAASSSSSGQSGPGMMVPGMGGGPRD